MPLPELQRILKQIEELTSGTRSGKFVWTAVNPSTYSWEKNPTDGNDGARITLQKVTQIVAERVSSGVGISTSRPVKRSHFILQIFELRSGLVPQPHLKLSVTGEDDSDLNLALANLYDLVSSGISEAGLSFFDDLIH
jgi:hypothetical protein